MGMKCLVCCNIYEPLSNVSFHRFPKNSEGFYKWAKICRRFDLLDKGPYICYRTYKLYSEHFVKTDFKTDCRLNSDAMPSVFSWPEETIPSTSGIIAVKMENSVDIYSESLLSTNWLNTSATSCSTSKTTSASRSLTYGSDYSSTSETQKHQSLSKNTPQKAKLNDLLSTQKNKYNDLHTQLLALKKHCSNQEKKSSTLEFFHLMCDNFLDKGFDNFVKVQSKLTLQDPHGYGFSYEKTICTHGTFFGS